MTGTSAGREGPTAGAGDADGLVRGHHNVRGSLV